MNQGQAAFTMNIKIKKGENPLGYFHTSPLFSRREQTMSEDTAIHVLYERIGHLLCEQPYGEMGRYLTYYAEDRLYLVFDLWYHGFFLVEAKSPKDAIDKVNYDQLAYVPKGEEDD